VNRKLLENTSNYRLNAIDRFRKINEEHDNGVIAILDDEKSIQLCVSKMLERIEFKTMQFTYAFDFLETIRKKEQEIMLLITDTWIPLGRERIKRIWTASDIIYLEACKEFPNLKVLYVSGHSLVEVRKYHGNVCPEAKFLQKPFTMIQLVEKVYEILRDFKND